MVKNIFKNPAYGVVLWGLLLFIPFLGNVHLFDWDEINFAENAREMLITGNYQQVQINFQPFWEKPPLFFWLQTLSFKLFGVNEFAARFPNALVGVVVILWVYLIAKKYFNTQFALIWVLCITGSLTPHLYYKSGIIDPIYNLFISATIYQFFLIATSTQSGHKNFNALYAGLFIGAAIITKGPVALLVCLLCLLVYLAINKLKLFFNIQQVLICALAALMVSATWFGFEVYKNGPTFLIEFILYQIDLFKNPVAGHGQPFWYHPVVLFLGCFPISIFALKTLFSKKYFIDNPIQIAFITWNKVLFWVVLILFSLVKTKIVHYSSACYLPLTFMAAHSIYGYMYQNQKLSKWKISIIYVIGLILGLVLGLIPLIDIFKDQIIPLIDDEFAVACLNINANWQGLEFLLGFIFIASVSVSVFYMWKNEIKKGIFTLLVSISLFLPIYLTWVVPKIEQYSQGPAIDMLKTISNQDCYITTLGYKSYAHYFYGNVKPFANDSARDIVWLKIGNIDKPAYFLLHVNDTQNHTNPQMKVIDTKGGFMLMKRETQR